MVPAAETEALAAALGDLAANEGLRQRLGEAAERRFHAEFTEERMVRDTAGWLMKAAGQRPEQGGASEDASA